ncbi:vitamin K epoxide reductase complex subunit 1-like [Argiope bruennichi]|uniref:vitamin K epoxide reductase complex subunit 1-like n=1 Tax=Argiope bruennichi TaxID=94029 RepID=UPI002494BE6C|nr:vitamin K epoxide reductase complex subunit 1-like [Argiope bruennichi]
MATAPKHYDIDLKVLQIATALCCISGLLLSIYAYHVEVKKEEDANYTAMCDISEHMSCTAAFSSQYGKGFGFMEHIVGKDSILNQPNSVYGIIFYLIFMPLAEIPNLTLSKIMILLAVLSNICSIYLAYILIYILYDFCIVCVSTYIVNFVLLICSLFRYTFHSKRMKLYASKKIS